ncbi:MAG: hypothetical protein COU06_01590 [Candidatus Harrisonbacteria bacterium CG10_big_fil_rev_8_21_14_0_10_38_8]|uniref:Acetate kinase n=1 Tax=Candidatus Harrisonbacteria bacterium CG10_big_fil_rev_8_21_14_0_10_38_8 TaxID=1974582 RepID=A0A2M6WK28_9BACT|nr:MAG: hypothetical protein COU06_01590 [Candidatus Harrisonbacteria bacterium CG10_big_fil_rev_8_21_14_0_10_38_8]
MDVILIINIGSSSKKYTAYQGNQEILSAHFEHVKKGFLVTWGNKEEKINKDQFNTAIKIFTDKLQQLPLAVGVRIVAPGFTTHKEIDDTYIQSLKKTEEFASEHITSTLEEIMKIKDLFPKTKIFGVSDSAFHVTMAQNFYALPKDITQQLDIHRYGYHGLSVESVKEKLINNFTLKARTIITHLGSGTSVTALLNGESIYNSMGYSPLSGAVMARRSGSIDPSIVTLLIERLNLSPREVEKKLNSESGLLGVSKLSPDIRVLLKAEKNGNQDAHQALELYIESIREYIGVAVTKLGGIDALVLTGTVSERSHQIRKRVLTNLEFLKISFANNRSSKVLGGVDELISKNNRPPVYVLTSNENQMMYQLVKNLL